MRKRMNQVKKLQRDDGMWVDGQNGVRQVVIDYFTDLFSCSSPSDGSRFLEAMDTFLSPDQIDILSQAFSREEVYNALQQINPTKAPRPDGMSSLFLSNLLGNCWR
ncbi:hypothetical protein M5689_025031 [Euphorbia peplus]|nr:hypothetical protein M5689_025031 [Euphorbia peplus]